MRNGIYFVCFLFLLLILNCKGKHEDVIIGPVGDDYFITTVNELNDTTYTRQIDSLYESGVEGFFLGRSDVKIYYKLFKQNNTEKAIVISSGRTEAAIKYKELIFDLYMNGFSVYIHDHRGQGFSGRMTQNPQMGYIDSFQFYIDDLKFFYDNFVSKRSYKKTYLLAHSMGGAIGMTYIQQHPNDFSAASFSSPMLGFKPGICKLTSLLENDQPKFAIGQTEYNDKKNSFEDNALTGSKVRFDRMLEVYKKHPVARLGGVTYNWLSRSCEQFEYMLDHINMVQTPFVLFSAENEDIVSIKAHSKFINAAKEQNKICEYVEIEDAQHELFIETDNIRNKVMNKTLDFFSSY